MWNDKTDASQSETTTMNSTFLPLTLLALVLHAPGKYTPDQTLPQPQSWTYFLQHLPAVDAPILDYRGHKVADQEKHVAIIPYDVGTSDLQQCADALMRLRAEYLFAAGRFSDIGFHFTNHLYYSFTAYCKGVRPVANGERLRIAAASASPDHKALRQYLDLVYVYAGTLSLEQELKTATDFTIGTVIIHGGSPGHCFIIIDKKTAANGERLFKLAEGYTPAQSIYILSNPYEPSISPWYRLRKGVIHTASYTFTNYTLRRFE
jgi:hypothetical protein